MPNITKMLEDIFSNSDTTIKPKKESNVFNIVETVYEDAGLDCGPWIAGGMGRNIAVGETSYNDIDVWFKTPYQLEQTKKRLENAFGWEMFESYNSDNALTYKIGKHTVQLIKRDYYKNIDEVFANFDFTCCQIGVDKDLKIYGPGIQDAMNYKLKVQKLDRKGFLARYAKYVGYGYTMNPEEFVKIIETEELNYEFDGATLGY